MDVHYFWKLSPNISQAVLHIIMKTFWEGFSEEFSNSERTSVASGPTDLVSEKLDMSRPCAAQRGPLWTLVQWTW